VATNSNADKTSENNRLVEAASFNPSLFAFISGRIYTAVPGDTTDQEFISGAAVPVPEPGTILLIGVGMFGNAICAKRSMSKEF